MGIGLKVALSLILYSGLEHFDEEPELQAADKLVMQALVGVEVLLDLVDTLVQNIMDRLGKYEELFVGKLVQYQLHTITEHTS